MSDRIDVCHINGYSLQGTKLYNPNTPTSTLKDLSLPGAERTS